MFTVTSKLAWGLTPLFIFSIVSGCSPEYRSASAKSKLDYWAPKDPWPNQKEGVCCFVYKDPPPEETVVATTGPEACGAGAPSSRISIRASGPIARRAAASSFDR